MFKKNNKNNEEVIRMEQTTFILNNNVETLTRSLRFSIREKNLDYYERYTLLKKVTFVVD